MIFIFIQLLMVYSLSFEFSQINKAINYWKYYKTFTITDNDIVKMPMTDQYSYTLTLVHYPYTSKIYIDSNKFLYAPNSFYNVMLHEIGHYIGKKHNNDSKSIMNYSVSVRYKGDYVMEDYPRLLSSTDIC